MTDEDMAFALDSEVEHWHARAVEAEAEVRALRAEVEDLAQRLRDTGGLLAGFVLRTGEPLVDANLCMMRERDEARAYALRLHRAASVAEADLLRLGGLMQATHLGDVTCSAPPFVRDAPDE